MPVPFADQARGEIIECNPDLETTIRGEHAEALAQMLGDGEIRRPAKPHPRELKGVQLRTDEVVGEKRPLLVDAREIVGLHTPGLETRTAQFSIFEGEFFSPSQTAVSYQ